jgi:hypothetical protein
MTIVAIVETILDKTAFALKSLGIVPHDKVMHLVCGAALGAVLIAAMAPFVSISLMLACLLSFLIVSGVGFAKEVYDYLHPENHTADFWDFLATAAGGLACSSIGYFGYHAWLFLAAM